MLKHWILQELLKRLKEEGFISSWIADVVFKRLEETNALVEGALSYPESTKQIIREAIKTEAFSVIKNRTSRRILEKYE